LPAKGCDVSQKTISKNTFPSASSDHQGKIDRLGLRGLVGAYDADKKLIGVKTTDSHIPFDQITSTPPPPIDVYTGDYDAHDMFSKGGAKIRDGSTEEKNFRRNLNRNTRGTGKRTEMIRHGPQANYADYARRKGKKPVPSLLLPDVSKEEPLLCFDANGEMYLINNEDDLKKYYTCKGQEIPPEWKEPKRSKIQAQVDADKAKK